MLPYNRALHPDDYDHMVAYVDQVRAFEHVMIDKGVPFRKDHEHRTWEYANVLRQLDELQVRRILNERPVCVLDTGAGGSSLAPMLAHKGYRVIVTDSMAYGDIVLPFIEPQCRQLGLDIPVWTEPVEAMPRLADGTFDVTMCISVIEHVDAKFFVQGLKELCRVTKPGGYLFLTSDFFADEAQVESSPYKQIQHTAFTPELAARIPQLINADYVGGQDFKYRGDFVHNYSFVNMCLRKQ